MKNSSGKVMRALSLVAAMILASEVILSAVFYLSGTVTPRKAGDIVKVIQGSLASPPEEPAAAEASKEAAEPIELKSQEALQTAVAQWRKAKKQQEDALAAERDAVISMKSELEKVRAEIDAREKDLQTRLTEFGKRKAEEETAASEQGFKDAVGTYEAMEAKEVANALLGLNDTIVVRYLKAFKTAFRAEILSEMAKIDPAKPAAGEGKPNRVARLLEIIRGGDAAAATEAVASAAK